MCHKCKFSVTSQNLHTVLLFPKRNKGGQERGWLYWATGGRKGKWKWVRSRGERVSREQWGLIERVKPRFQWENWDWGRGPSQGVLSTYFGCLKAMRHRSYFPTMLQAMTRPSVLPDRRCHWSKYRHFTAPSWPLSVCKKRCLCSQPIFSPNSDSSRSRAGGFLRRIPKALSTNLWPPHWESAWVHCMSALRRLVRFRQPALQSSLPS